MTRKKFYTKNINIRIRPETYERLEMIADLMNMDVSKLMRKILEEYLA
ncbi:MAG: ribbon-helix-helix protein, CopG family [Candidatus Thorarchaeota archaeon]